MTTKDAGLIASLHVLGFKEESVDASNPREIYFIFPESPEITQLATDYYSSNLMLSAFAFHQSLKQLKSHIHFLGEKHENKSYLYR